MATLNVKQFPDALYHALKARAEAEHRSVAQEVTHIIAQAIGERPLSILDLEGLGKELWSGMDAASHIAVERDSWD
jgi:plasmid stability protein